MGATTEDCDIPELQPRASFAQAAAGWTHIVLLRTSGMAVACGRNLAGQGDVPEIEPGASDAHVPRGREFSHGVAAER